VAGKAGDEAIMRFAQLQYKKKILVLQLHWTCANRVSAKSYACYTERSADARILISSEDFAAIDKKLTSIT